MFSKLTTVVPNGIRLNGSSTRFCACTRTRRIVLVVVAVLLFAELVWTVVFSNWNVCRADLDDDVDALNAAHRSSTGSSRWQRPDKICLSPQTDSGLRVNMSIDSDIDLRR